MRALNVSDFPMNRFGEAEMVECGRTQRGGDAFHGREADVAQADQRLQTIDDGRCSGDPASSLHHAADIELQRRQRLSELVV